MNATYWERGLELYCDESNLEELYKYLFCSFIFGAGVDYLLLLRSFIGLLYQPRMIDDDDCGAVSEINQWQGKPKYSEETCPIAALCTTDHS
jgi:hypothetical protein